MKIDAGTLAQMLQELDGNNDPASNRLRDVLISYEAMLYGHSVLLADFTRVHDALHGCVCTFVPSNDGASTECSHLLKATAHWIEESP